MFDRVLASFEASAPMHIEAAHPCEQEVQSACPDRPGSELARREDAAAEVLSDTLGNGWLM